MFYLRKFTSRIIDYFFFFYVSTIFYEVDVFNVNYWLSVFFIPILWIPLEVIQIALFGTTLGKALVNLHLLNRENQKPTLSESIKSSIGSGLKIQLFFIPGVNRLFGSHFHQTQLVITKFKLQKFLISFASASLIALALLKIDALFIHHKDKGSFFDWSGSNWSQFKGENFSAYFPKEPVSISKEIPLPTPSHSDVLPYQEYSHTHDKGKYEVSFTTLPSQWMKWSSGLILSGAVKLVMGKSKIVHKHSATCYNFPAIEYEAESSNGHILGKLVLVEQKLYRVEVLYKEPEGKEEAIRFIESFIPGVI